MISVKLFKTLPKGAFQRPDWKETWSTINRDSYRSTIGNAILLLLNMHGEY